MDAAGYKLYNEVQLTRNLPEMGFINGDVATIIDIIISPDNKKTYCLEFFDKQGDTLQVALVPEDAVQIPIRHAVVNYREYVKIKINRQSN